MTAEGQLRQEGRVQGHPARQPREALLGPFQGAGDPGRRPRGSTAARTSKVGGHRGWRRHGDGGGNLQESLSAACVCACVCVCECVRVLVFSKISGSLGDWSR